MSVLGISDDALLGFRMWLEYLRSCPLGDPLKPDGCLVGLNYPVEQEQDWDVYRGVMPEYPTGPLKAAVMGTNWVAYIKAIIESCANKQAAVDLFQLINAQSDHYHDVNYLYETLRRADCRELASKNSVENKQSYSNYVSQNPHQTYSAFFITCTDERLSAHNPTYYELLEAVLKRHGCTYAIISMCRQTILHHHGVLMFAWPITIEGLRDLLGLVAFKNRAVVWDIQACFTNTDHGICYILAQEIRRKIYFHPEGYQPNPFIAKELYEGNMPEAKLSYMPKYKAVQLGIVQPDEIYKQQGDFDEYARSVKSVTMTQDQSELALCLKCFGEEAVVDARADRNLLYNNPLQKPVVVIDPVMTVDVRRSMLTVASALYRPIPYPIIIVAQC